MNHSKEQDAGLFSEQPTPVATAQKTKPRKARGGYTPDVGDKPKLPTTGSGVNPSNALAVLDRPTTVLELCMMAAKDPTIPVDRLRAFLDMADEQERKEAETLFDNAMLAAQTAIPPITRESFNKHTKSWWAKIEKISSIIDPIARSHGFTLKYGVGEQRIEDHYHIFVDVTWNGALSSGKRASFTKRYDADIGRDDKGPKGEGTKSLAQGAGSSITYGRRFLKCMVFDAQILGADNDGNPIGLEADAVTEAQAQELLDVCAAKNIDLKTFQTAFKVDGPAQLPRHRFEDVIARLKTAPTKKAMADKPAADQQ